MPDGMSVDDRDAFRRWHDKLTREGYVFDFRHELLEYCKSDVLFLKQGCMTFKREFEAKAGFDPFDQMTIASACNRYLRTHCLQPNTIACEPLLGWGGRRVNQSSAAFEWLAWEAHLVPTPLRHAHNGGEVRPLPDRRYTVNGFNAMTQTVYEFDGCFWHGCPTCFPQRHESHPRLLGRTMDDVFALRQEKHDLLRQYGYLVRSIWECEWSRRRAADPAIQTFLQTHQTPRPLDPRDAFFGGRTNAYQLYRCVEGDERILYYDFKSLYPYVNPYVNKYCIWSKGSPDHLPTTRRTRARRVLRTRVLYHLTTHRSVASRLAVPMQPETHTAKKVAFTRLENYRLTSQNAAFCIHSLAFSDCKILGFPFVFLTVNSSFRSIIRQFSNTVNSRKTSHFTGVHRMVNALKIDCFPLFSGVFRSHNRVLTGVYGSFLSFTLCSPRG